MGRKLCNRSLTQEEAAAKAAEHAVSEVRRVAKMALERWFAAASVAAIRKLPEEQRNENLKVMASIDGWIKMKRCTRRIRHAPKSNFWQQDPRHRKAGSFTQWSRQIDVPSVTSAVEEPLSARKKGFIASVEVQAMARIFHPSSFTRGCVAM